MWYAIWKDQQDKVCGFIKDDDGMPKEWESEEAAEEGMKSHILEYKTPLMTERKLFRMCRSKKRRIKRKWLKNPKNYRMMPINSYIYNEQQRTIHCHPVIAERIIKAIDNQSQSKTCLMP